MRKLDWFIQLSIIPIYLLMSIVLSKVHFVINLQLPMCEGELANCEMKHHSRFWESEDDYMGYGGFGGFRRGWVGDF